MDENVDYDERESEFDVEDEDRSVQLNEEEKLGDDVEVSRLIFLRFVLWPQEHIGVHKTKLVTPGKLE